MRSMSQKSYTDWWYD